MRSASPGSPPDGPSTISEDECVESNLALIRVMRGRKIAESTTSAQLAKHVADHCERCRPCRLELKAIRMVSTSCGRSPTLEEFFEIHRVGRGDPQRFNARLREAWARSGRN